MALVRSTIPSLIGPLTIEVTDAGVRAIRFDPARWPAVEPTSPAASREVAVEDHPVLAAAADQLDAYFARTLRTFDLPLDLRVTAFQRDVLTELAAVPYGEVVSYLDLAIAIGRDATSARAVGGACNANPVPIVIPCHRIVAADGSLGGYAAGLDAKRLLLSLERGPAVPLGGWEPAAAPPPEVPRLFDL